MILFSLRSVFTAAKSMWILVLIIVIYLFEPIGKYLLSFKVYLKMMKRCRNDSRRNLRFDEGWWKDGEKIHDDIQGSTKVIGKIFKRSTAIFKDRRRMMERWRNILLLYYRIVEVRWKNAEKLWAILKDRQRKM